MISHVPVYLFGLGHVLETVRLLPCRMEAGGRSTELLCMIFSPQKNSLEFKACWKRQLGLSRLLEHVIPRILSFFSRTLLLNLHSDPDNFIAQIRHSLGAVIMNVKY